MRSGLPSGTSFWLMHKIHTFSDFSSFNSPYQYCQEQNTNFGYHQLYHVGTRNDYNPKRKLPVSADLLVLLNINGKKI